MEFKASRLKALLLTVGSALFVLAGVYMIDVRPFIGWIAVCFFGACGLLGILLLLTGGARLKLDEDGFEMAGLFKTRRFRWTEIESIRTAKVRGAKVIALNYKDGHPRTSAVSRALTGMDASVGNIYNVSLDELCKEMNGWHARYGRAV